MLPLVLGREQQLRGVSIALVVIQLLLLCGGALALRREIDAQRLMISRAGPGTKSSRAGRAVSRGRVRLLAAACLLVAVLIGL